ncbi:MAG: tetratricopeptide repeat protein [Acidobacteria bacterium]|nr:tetratricopeptide repeat protein [Acidobacteriota bacterium]
MTVSRTASFALAAVLVAALCPPPVFGQAQADAYFEFLMARRLEADGNTAAAFVALGRAAAADRTSSEIRAEIAAFQLRQDKLAEAAKAANEARALDDTNIEAHRVLGLVSTAGADDAFERRQGAQAMALAREAITHLEKVAPTPSADITLHYALGRLYLRIGEGEKAVQAFSRVLTQNPNSLQGRMSLAQAHAATDNLKGAIGVLEEIVGDEPRIAATLAQYQEQAGLFREAAASYTVALMVTPTSRDLKFRRIAMLINAKEFATAAALAEEARSAHTDDLRFPRMRARAFIEGGESERAVAVLEGAARTFPKDLSTQFALADLYITLRRPADAERTMRQVLVADPTNVDVMNYLGYMLAEQGEHLDEAISLVRRALQADPENPSYLDSLGWAYFRKGKFEDAQKYLAPAAEKLPGNAVIQSHLGDTLARRNRWPDAIAAWRKALEGDGEIDRPAVERKIQDAQRRLNR